MGFKKIATIHMVAKRFFIFTKVVTHFAYLSTPELHNKGKIGTTSASHAYEGIIKSYFLSAKMQKLFRPIICCISVFFILILVFFIHAFPFSTNGANAKTSTFTIPATNPTSRWRLYVDPEAHFEVRYPCDATCAAMPPTAGKNSYLLRDVYLPTSDPAIGVSIGYFTEQSVSDSNALLSKPCPSDNECEGRSFDTDLQKLKQALESPVGTLLEIKASGSDTSLSEKFEVVSINGIKALRGAVPNSYFANRLYYVLNGDKWIRIEISYWNIHTQNDEEAGMIGNPREMDAGTEVLNTFQFVR
jgi:hypothetical protein